MDDIIKQKISKIVSTFCQNRVPPHARDQVKMFYKIRGNDVNIYESRPHWQDNTRWIDMPIAKIRYLPDQKSWQLMFVRLNDKWQKYPDFPPTKDINKIISEIDEDPYHVFWG